MRKLSKAQEMVLRQADAGQVKLVFVGNNEHSVRVWNAVGKGGRNINPTYDALRKMNLIVSPLAPEGMKWSERSVILTILGEEVVKALGPAGELLISDFAPGTGDSWMIRKEKGETMPYVLYFNNVVYDRYSRAESVYKVYRTHCPYVENVEASLSR